MIDQLGGRKAIGLIIMSLLGVGAVFLKGDVPSNFMSLMQFVFAAFIAGNAVEHAAGAYTDARVTPDAPEAAVAAPAVDLSPLVDKLHTQEAALAATQEGVATIQQTLTFIIQKTGLNAQ